MAVITTRHWRHRPGVTISAPEPGPVSGHILAPSEITASPAAGAGELGFDSDICSDTAPLNGLVSALLSANAAAVHVLRDPTRGGLATTLNEIARQSQVGILLEEDRIPVRPAVAAACEMLGFDPLYVANEGKLVAIVAPHAAQDVLDAMRSHAYGTEAAIIGRVEAGAPGQVLMKTAIGGTRVVDMLAGEMLPRICWARPGRHGNNHLNTSCIPACSFSIAALRNQLSRRSNPFSTATWLLKMGVS